MSISLTKKHYPLLGINLFTILFFGINFLRTGNHEFLIYIAWVIFLFVVVLFTLWRIKYDMVLLWCLSIGGFFHMAGWWFTYKGVIWYQAIIIPLSKEYELIKYDQLIHILGSFAMTILWYNMLKPHLKKTNISIALSLIIVLIWIWFWALNEFVEFLVYLSIPENAVWGYLNTSIDLSANLLWAVIALIFIKVFLEKKYVKKDNSSITI